MVRWTLASRTCTHFRQTPEMKKLSRDIVTALLFIKKKKKNLLWCRHRVVYSMTFQFPSDSKFFLSDPVMWHLWYYFCALWSPFYLALTQWSSRVNKQLWYQYIQVNKGNHVFVFVSRGYFTLALSLVVGFHHIISPVSVLKLSKGSSWKLGGQDNNLDYVSRDKVIYPLFPRDFLAC